MIKKLKFFNFQKAYKPSRLKTGTWIEWSLLAIVFIVSFFIFMYVDITNTIDNSVLFSKAVFSGNFFNFYDYSIDNANTSFPANYEMLAYIPFAIWNLPLAIGNMLFDFDYMHSTLALLWAKSFIVVLAVVMMYYVYKILRFIKVEKEKAVFGIYTLSTSFLFFWPVFIIVQIDIVAVVLILIGFYHYLKNNNKLFILFFALAIPLKLFALLLFIPLLLLKEKRVIFIGIKIVLVYLAELMCMLIYHGSEAYNFALKSQSEDAMSALFNFTDALGARKTSLFIIAFFALCLFCYLYKLDKKDDETKLSMPVLVSTLLWGSLMIFVELRGYWLIYLAPFLIFSIFSAKRFLKVNLMLELLSGGSYVLWHLSSNSNIGKENDAVWRLLLYRFVEHNDTSVLKYKNIHGLFTYYGLDKFKYVLFTVFICSLAAIIILSCPYIFKKVKTDALIDRSVIIIRPLAILVLIGLYIFAYSATENPMVYNFIDKDKNSSSSCDLLDNNTMSQTMTFDKDFKLNQLKVVFDNSNPNRNNFCSVNITIHNVTDGKDVFTKRVGCSLIKDDKSTTVDLNNTYVNSDDKYEIIFTAQEGVDDSVLGYKNTIALYKTDTLKDSDNPAVINGEKQNFNIAFSIR